MTHQRSRGGLIALLTAQCGLQPFVAHAPAASAYCQRFSQVLPGHFPCEHAASVALLTTPWDGPRVRASNGT